MPTDATITALFQDAHTVAILGYGQEGRSSCRLLRKHLPRIKIHVCDNDAGLDIEKPEGLADDKQTQYFLGAHYLEGLKGADTIIKSPGISSGMLKDFRVSGTITSQTELFVKRFRKQIIGITGTKGKSTTSSLLDHIYQQAGIPSILVGNIGVPPFDLISRISDDTRIVFEMSSHQLEQLCVSPHIAIFLNIYQEHLDHYPSYEHYKQAKLNIARWQDDQDYLLYNADNKELISLLRIPDIKAQKILFGQKNKQGFCACYQDEDLMVSLPGKQMLVQGLASRSPLQGSHNKINMAAAVAAACLDDIKPELIAEAVGNFKGLPHRLELAGTYKGVTFCDDSISTIPESTIAAIQTFPQTDAIMLGGFDRGVDYGPLMDFIGRSPVRTLVFTGNAGFRMQALTTTNAAYQDKRCLFEKEFDNAFRVAAAACRSGGICLLSPAAASYDAFKNFTERGNRFKQLAQQFNDPS